MSSLLLEHYPLPRRFLHWLSAVVILWATFSGFTVALTQLPKPVGQAISNLNVSLALLFIPFFAVRFLLALISRNPATPGLNARQQQAATFIQRLIYAAIIIVLISGVLMMERPMSIFGLVTFQPLLPASALTRFFSALHHYSCAALALLVFVHVAGVALHHLRGLPIVRKML